MSKNHSTNALKNSLDDGLNHSPSESSKSNYADNLKTSTCGSSQINSSNGLKSNSSDDTNNCSNKNSEHNCVQNSVSDESHVIEVKPLNKKIIIN